MLDYKDLHGYQVEDAAAIVKRKRVALLCDMGLGKTVTVLTAIAQLMEMGEVPKILIVAPLRVAKHVWKQEAGGWAHTQGLVPKMHIAVGTVSARRAAIDRGGITIINRENMEWLVKAYPRRSWDMLVVDESSSFKSSNTQRFRALKKMLVADLKYRVLLSGTPTPNGLMDLWSQLFILDGGARLGRTKGAFLSRWYHAHPYIRFKFVLNEGMGAEKEIRERISDICRTRAVEDYLDLPPLVYVDVVVDLPRGVQVRYAALKKDFVYALEGLESGVESVEVESALALGTKLMQVSNGFIYREDGEVVVLHDEKIRALQGIVDDNPGENILVAYQYKADLERIRTAFPEAVCVTDEGVGDVFERWNKGEIGMLLAHPASCGHGLNLQGGGGLVVWFGLGWSLELYQQFNKRLHRQGQTRVGGVVVAHIVGAGCIDVEILGALGRKDVVQSGLLEYLKV